MPQPAELQALILSELDAPEPHLTALEDQIAVIWSLYAGKGYVSARLQFLYARRHAIQFLIGRHYQDVSRSDAGVSVQDQQLASNLETLLQAVNQEIQEEEGLFRGNAAPEAGTLAATAPVEVTGTLTPDPNHPYYRGSPIWRR